MAGSRTDSRKAERMRTVRRRTTWTLAVMLAGVLGLPLLGYVDWSGIGGAASVAQEAPAQPPAEEAGFRGGENPRANYWGAVREGVEGTSTVRGVGMNTLIQNGGEIYRELRNGPLVTYGAGLMGLMLAGLIIFFLARGRVKLEEGRSGRKVPRFSELERYVHWSVAVLFIILALTGLALLYGRAVLIPLLGPEGFAATASLSKTTHNFLGPLFAIALVVMLVLFIRDNIPSRADGRWLARMGRRKGEKLGIGRFNLGEKGWYWLVTVAGLVVIVTGLIMDFTIFGQSRETLQVSQLLHSVGGILMITGALGHIYMGTIGMEGSWEGMAHGEVDVNWAREHHDGWYAEMERRGLTGGAPAGPEPGAEPRGAPGGS